MVSRGHPGGRYQPLLELGTWDFSGAWSLGFGAFTTMSSKLKKVLLAVLALAMLFGVSFVQKSLNVDRERLGTTRLQPLENAPPVLAFTTMAVGGVRGISPDAPS